MHIYVKRNVNTFRKEIYKMDMDFNGLGASSLSKASGNNYQYVVLQVTLKEKFLGTGSGNLSELEMVINKQASK